LLVEDILYLEDAAAATDLRRCNRCNKAGVHIASQVLSLLEDIPYLEDILY
jgi:hypothetical protein